MLLAAITGGIGSGKSTVSAQLAAHGAPLVDADRVAREVVAPGGAAYQPLLERFGSGIRSADGSIDRPALAAIAFNDPAALADLNAITHPAIGVEVLRRLQALEAHRGPVVLDIPLLDASTIALYRPRALIVVDTPEDVAVARLVSHRGFSEPDARARVAVQSSRAERRALLDLVEFATVVDNAGDQAALQEAIDALWRWLTSLPA